MNQQLKAWTRSPRVWAIAVISVLVILRATGVTAPDVGARPSRVVSVQYVFDGDTFQTAEGERVRLLGIDTPELAHEDQPEQDFAFEARDQLCQLVERCTVRLEFDERTQDRYGRTLAWVYLQDGTLVNQCLLQAGLARVFDQFGLPQDLEIPLRKAEASARVRKIGLWAGKSGTSTDATVPSSFERDPAAASRDAVR